MRADGIPRAKLSDRVAAMALHSKDPMEDEAENWPEPNLQSARNFQDWREGESKLERFLGKEGPRFPDSHQVNSRRNFQIDPPAPLSKITSCALVVRSKQEEERLGLLRADW